MNNLNKVVMLEWLEEKEKEYNKLGLVNTTDLLIKDMRDEILRDDVGAITEHND